jgi:hypothetical protein
MPRRQKLECVGASDYTSLQEICVTPSGERLPIQIMVTVRTTPTDPKARPIVLRSVMANR